ncbi:PQ loop repeat-domain-containing protein [Mycena belliarum]|uniref:PQ loop repeat-domain-containing protein n=1 Tax=Mycena belliarum TaxID=1033014 RepID=A0AAD6UAL8_9AGAR|nr:PQ loop repeat-domain-containing protein [Mycena belliae]
MSFVVMLAESADFSSMLGWVSIACWIVVYSPQIYENYSRQSGDGLSVPFVLIWLLGDLCNLIGAALAHLLPTMILIAIYYSLCDITLMSQIYFYRRKRVKAGHPPCEETPLLHADDSAENTESKVPVVVLILRYTGALFCVFATGVLSWWISRNTEETGSPPKQSPQPPSADMQWTIQILGWTSAVLYLGSRLPQIAKNLETRCKGLSPALFFFAILGNSTYSMSIIAKSTDRDYLITNASWLAGSALTVFLDVIVLGQFLYYRQVVGPSSSD